MSTSQTEQLASAYMSHRIMVVSLCSLELFV